MENKRTKLWRRQQAFRVFKARMIYYASFQEAGWDYEGEFHPALHWFELAREPWAQVYRTTGTPCSCMICQGERYNRLDFKRETRRIIRESLDE